MKNLICFITLLITVGSFAGEDLSYDFNFDTKLELEESVVFTDPFYETKTVLGGGYRRIYFKNNKQTQNEVCLREGYLKSAEKGNLKQTGSFSGWWEIATFQADRDGIFSFISNENTAYYNVIGQLTCLK